MSYMEYVYTMAMVIGTILLMSALVVVIHVFQWLVISFPQWLADRTKK